MNDPDIRYARSGDVSVAYTVVGSGPFDVVFVSGWTLSNLGVAWEGTAADFYQVMASACRLILFDKRGTGLSDRITGIPDLQTRMDDVRAVMDAAGSSRAAVLGFSEGGPMAALFAATYPERTAALVLYGTLPTFHQGPDYPWRPPRSELIRRIDDVDRSGQRLTDAWCDEELRANAPTTVGDTEVHRWWRRWTRTSGSPNTYSALARMNAEIDVRHVLPSVRVPTLVLHRIGDEDITIEEGRYLAEHIPGSRLVELAGVDHGWWFDSSQLTDSILPFLDELWRAGQWDETDVDRVLATVLFTDIADSTSRLADVGDRQWRELLLEHNRLVRAQLARFNGREVDAAGDGFFAAFDGPARAIRCAAAIGAAVREIGIEVRAGLHAGECEVVDGKISGIAVHIGARVAAAAAPGEVLVSSTVRDLVAGSGLSFEERGDHELKGVPGRWNLFALADDRPSSPPSDQATAWDRDGPVRPPAAPRRGSGRP